MVSSSILPSLALQILHCLLPVNTGGTVVHVCNPDAPVMRLHVVVWCSVVAASAMTCSPSTPAERSCPRNPGIVAIIVLLVWWWRCSDGALAMTSRSLPCSSVCSVDADGMVVLLLSQPQLRRIDSGVLIVAPSVSYSPPCPLYYSLVVAWPLSQGTNV
jgi:hypothetical protein